MVSSNLEKGPGRPPWTTFLAFLRTRRGIAALVALGCVTVAVIVVIALAATGIIRANGASNGSKLEDLDVSSLTSSVLMAASTTASAIGLFTSTSTPGSTSTSTPSMITSLELDTSSIMSSTTSSAVSSSTLSSTSSSKSSSTSPATSSAAPSIASTSTTSSSDIPLRIMALGASIVKGETSPGYLGFRKSMRDELAELGYTVNMVGSVRLGDFVDNDVEAYGGKKVKEIHDYAKKIVPQTQPNVFVINLGTNNLLQNKDVDKVGQQMEAMINYLLETSKQSAVILSTMLTNKVPNLEPKVLDMNQQYRDIMKNFESDGKRVVLAEMHPSQGISGVPTESDIGPDGSHPTVEGYEIMGRIFVQAIQEADKRGFLRKPVDNGIPADGEKERNG